MSTSDSKEDRAIVAEVRSRQRHPPAPPRIAEVMSGLMARRGYAQIQTASDIDSAWREATGEELAKDSRPGNIKRGVLEVMVSNSTVMQELTFQKKRLLGAIQGELPECKIRDLRFRLGS